MVVSQLKVIDTTNCLGKKSRGEFNRSLVGKLRSLKGKWLWIEQTPPFRQRTKHQSRDIDLLFIPYVEMLNRLS